MLEARLRAMIEDWRNRADRLGARFTNEEEAKAETLYESASELEELLNERAEPTDPDLDRFGYEHG